MKSSGNAKDVLNLAMFSCLMIIYVIKGMCIFGGLCVTFGKCGLLLEFEGYDTH